MSRSPQDSGAELKQRIERVKYRAGQLPPLRRVAVEDVTGDF